MSPRSHQRQFTRLDFAALQDIGWQVQPRVLQPPTSLPGDANRDGVFNSSDLILVFQAGEYEDGRSNNSTWEEGDWNGDGDFDSSDLVFALQQGSYRRYALPTSPVPTLYQAADDTLVDGLLEVDALKADQVMSCLDPQMLLECATA